MKYSFCINFLRYNLVFNLTLMTLAPGFVFSAAGAGSDSAPKLTEKASSQALKPEGHSRTAGEIVVKTTSESFVSESNRKTVTGQIKCAADLGSGHSRFLAAEVHKKNHKILNVLHKTEVRRPFREHVKDETLSADGLKMLVDTLEEFYALCKEKGGAFVEAVATSSLRNAKKNKDQVLEQVQSLFADRVSLKVLSGVEEAQMGMDSVRALRNIPRTKSLSVWDIGGGSQQIGHYDSKTRTQLLESLNLGAASLQDAIASTLAKEKSKIVPLSSEDITKVQALIEKEATDFRGKFPKKFKMNSKVYGVGGVLSEMLPRFVKFKDGQCLSKSQIFRWASEFARFDEKKVLEKLPSDPYPQNVPTNLVMIVSIMNTFQIQSVCPVAGSNLTYAQVTALPQITSK